MILRWHLDARHEVDEAATFYRERQSGLELRFLDSLEAALIKIERHPQVYREVVIGVRKCRLQHFPFGVIFRVRPDHIEIIAVMHLRKKPRLHQY